MALMASRTARSSILSLWSRLAILLIPAVSTSSTGFPCHDHLTAMASLVSPGLSPVMTRFCCKSELTKVLFPTFCLPRIARRSGSGCSFVPSTSFVVVVDISNVCSNPKLFSFFIAKSSMIAAKSAIPSPCSADIGITSPKPILETSERCCMTEDSSLYTLLHASPSNLFPRMTTLLFHSVPFSSCRSSRSSCKSPPTLPPSSSNLCVPTFRNH
mmetsp:Transcript_33/g.70  ORF Transcript_33/g.70 Transcript_33/m.70 type:complete len:214 (+) Transcript_33:846-1487(+)